MMTEQEILNNRYRIDERLGSGGMAMVYRAHDLMLERNVAVKILRRNFSRDPEFRRRFQKEAQAAAKLSHPNIVTVHDFGYDENRLFMVMEYVPGSDLKTMVKQQGRIELYEALGLMLQACAGIGNAHQAGLVHCDIKPQNLLVTPEKQLKVVDFGIARALASISPDEKSDVVWGSPKYFSPEQASGRAPSPASDVYSLGVVFFEILTGQLPFIANSSDELARMHRDVPPPSPRKLNPLIPVEIEGFILQVLSKEPSNRYRNANQMGHVLRVLMQQIGISSYPTIIQDPNMFLSQKATITESETTLTHTPASGSPLVKPRSKKQLKVIRNTSHNLARKDFDWVTWTLALITLIAVGGLIPFWLWVYYIVYPPIK
jgi:serine/threonine-protein kinase